ncbi:DNA-binding transcriptional regulator, LysR family [Alkalibacterium subtropicum]|uniref:DNA-binding transcriptional regulator, LysR family n=1 Tax=Alkalibacterium subtropicum TaxID=753702 RepID=A0A1I1H3T5_9LACT|nr:LysR family transcriptional regulator [Alkalibacterium subtropicum]SFC16093.1 DNA-binding transcriptional regulator, LysR family [Alkalibacterium subtropicum]
MLDYRYKTFLVVANELNYTKAAKKLSLSQPAVSKHIRYIEQHLNTKLVNYEDRQLTLTRKGLFLKKKIEELEAEIEDVKLHLSDKVPERHVTLGASRTIGEYFIPSYTELLNIPDLKIDLVVDNTTRLLNHLEEGKIKYAFISGPVDTEKYCTRPFYRDSVILACSPEHPLAGKKVSINELFTENLLSREQGSGVCDSVEQFFKKHGLTCDQFRHNTRIGNIALLKNYIAANKGIGFLYAISVIEELDAHILDTITIEDVSFYQDFYLVCDKTNANKDEIDKIIHLFTKNLDADL